MDTSIDFVCHNRLLLLLRPVTAILASSGRQKIGESQKLRIIHRDALAVSLVLIGTEGLRRRLEV